MVAKSRSLINEVQFYTILISMVLVFAGVGVSLLIVSHIMFADLRNHSKDTAAEMAAFLEYPLYSVDHDQAVRIAETFLYSGKISGISLESVAAGTLLHKMDGEDSLRVPRITRNIYRQGMLLGKMTITFSDAEIIRTQSRIGIISLIVIALVLSANIVAVRFFITRRVRRPLEAIFGAVQNIADGNYETRIDRTPYRDVNIIVSHFNDMAAKIHQKNQEQKEIEDALRAERQFLMDVIDLLPDATFVIDTEGRVVAWNRAAEAMTGVGKVQMLGQGDYAYAVPFVGDRRPILIDLLDCPDKLTEKFYKYIRRSDSAIYAESFIQRLNKGRGAHLWGVAAPLYDNSGERTGAIEMIRDVTEYKEIEKERRNLQTQLHQAQKMESVGRLAGGVAHDFNNMLLVILGQTELALLECTENDPLKTALEAIQSAARRSADLTQKLLAFARKQMVVPKVVDINETVTGMLEMVRRLIGEDLDLVWTPAKDLWPVKIDPTQVDQILVNLTVNARDAISGVGKVGIETQSVCIDGGSCAAQPDIDPGEYVMLSVSDDGCGMTQDVLDHLFEPFFTTKPTGEGTGLGLATVYGIVKQNKGFVTVDSSVEGGTTFKVYLPRWSGEAKASQPVNRAKITRGSGETVLLVEDEPMILEVNRSMLKQLGYNVLAAVGPSDAIGLAKAHASELQLLITDVVMPEMNGNLLAELIDEIIPGLKRLFVSGYSSDVIANRAVMDEDLNFLQKPFTIHELAAKVRQVLTSE